MNDFFIYCIVGIFGGLGLFVYGFFQLKKKRMIENTPTSKIRSMAMGLTELKVKAIDQISLASPFTNKTVVYYRYTVEELRRNRKSTYWATIHKGDSLQSPFYVEDETGKVLVNPIGAEVNIPVDFTCQTGVLNGVPPHIISFLEAKGVATKSFFGFNKTLRFQEYHIAPGDSLYVLGVCKNNRDNLASKHRQKVIEVLKKVKANPQLMKQFDGNQDGQISQEEWEIARQTIENKVKAQFSDEDKVVIGKGEDRGQMFYISDQSEKSLVSGLAFAAFGGVFGGIAIFVFSLGYIVHVLSNVQSY